VVVQRVLARDSLPLRLLELRLVLVLRRVLELLGVTKLRRVLEDFAALAEQLLLQGAPAALEELDYLRAQDDLGHLVTELLQALGDLPGPVGPEEMEFRRAQDVLAVLEEQAQGGLVAGLVLVVPEEIALGPVGLAGFAARWDSVARLGSAVHWDFLLVQYLGHWGFLLVQYLGH